MENFLLDIEVDPVNKCTITPLKIDIVSLTSNESAYIYFDYGAAHFNGDFEHLVEFYLNSSTGIGGVLPGWGLSNSVNDYQGIHNAGGDVIYVQMREKLDGSGEISLVEGDGGTVYVDSFDGTTDTLYYGKIKRVVADSEFGTLYFHVYSDSERIVPVTSLSLALHSDLDYRYRYGASSLNRGGAPRAATGYWQNYDLQEDGVGVGHLVNGGLVNSGLTNGSLTA